MRLCLTILLIQRPKPRLSGCVQKYKHNEMTNSLQKPIADFHDESKDRPFTKTVSLLHPWQRLHFIQQLVVT